jgi:hypothetical protein
MENNFSLWCQKATEKIRYGPDRLVVSQELMDHLEDHREALMKQGFTREEAEQKALEAMGSAEEIAPQLGAIHRPWLGYLFSMIRAIAVTAAAFAIFLTVVNVWSLVFNIVSANRFDWLPNNFASVDYFCRPNVTDSSDGRFFQVTEAGYRSEHSEFYMEIRSIYWPNLENWGVFENFWAVDSFGNYYASIQQAAYQDIPCIHPLGWSTSTCIAHYHFLISNFDCDAQWVELHYDQDGRDVVLRIDLTGGNQNDKP